MRSEQRKGKLLRAFKLLQRYCTCNLGDERQGSARQGAKVKAEVMMTGRKKISITKQLTERIGNVENSI